MIVPLSLNPLCPMLSRYGLRVCLRAD